MRCKTYPSYHVVCGGCGKDVDTGRPKRSEAAAEAIVKGWRRTTDGWKCPKCRQGEGRVRETPPPYVVVLPPTKKAV